MPRSSTPVFPALPEAHVPRRRLVDAVGSDARVVCVVGGAGWGKSVALQELCRAASGPVVRIDAGQTARTAAGLLRAVLERIVDLAGGSHAETTAAAATARSIDVSAAHVPESLVREIAERSVPLLDGSGAWIVVDDLHEIERRMLPCWWSFVDRICASAPVVMASRQERSFPLSTWRLRDHVRVLDEVDLAFDVEEAVEVLARVDGEVVTPELAGRVIDETEGWPAGVTLRNRLDAATSDPIGAVLDSLEPGLRQFVDDTCVLGELSLAACHAMSGRHDAGSFLRELGGGGLFTVRMGDDRYRYRRPFRERLSEELRREHPERWEALHRRASQHHLAAGAVGIAASHLIDIGDHREALSLLLQHHQTVMETAQHLQLAPLLDRVPMPAVESDTMRTFALGFLVASSGHIVAGRDILDTLDETELPPDLRARVRWARLIISCSVGDVSDHDLEHPPDEPPERAVATFWRELPIALVLGDHLTAADDALAQGVEWGLTTTTDRLLQATTETLLTAWRGRIRDAIPDTSEAEDHLVEARDRPRAAYIRIPIARAMIECELGDPLTAISTLERAAAEFEGRVIPFTTHDVPMFRTIVRAFRLAGRPDLALARGQEFERAIDRSRIRLRRLISEEIVRSACSLGALEVAERAREDLVGPCSAPLADAWIAIARGDHARARSAVAPLDLADLTVRAPSRALDLLEVRAIAAPTARERDEFVAAAARLADEHGLRTSFECGLGALGPVPPRPVDGEPQPLSDRELDVLRGLASGVSHRELSALLDVSHNTLKTHLRAVYRKLGALDRGDALLRARTAGLIPATEAEPVRRR